MYCCFLSDHDGSAVSNISGSMRLGKFGMTKAQSGPAFGDTGEEGPYRFMAPEIYQRQPYDFKVDQYSWAMVTYQLFSGKRPLGHLAPVDAARAAAEGGARPTLEEASCPLRG